MLPSPKYVRQKAVSTAPNAAKLAPMAAEPRGPLLQRRATRGVEGGVGVGLEARWQGARVYAQRGRVRRAAFFVRAMMHARTGRRPATQHNMKDDETGRQAFDTCWVPKAYLPDEPCSRLARPGTEAGSLLARSA